MAQVKNTKTGEVASAHRLGVDGQGRELFFRPPDEWEPIGSVEYDRDGNWVVAESPAAKMGRSKSKAKAAAARANGAKGGRPSKMLTVDEVHAELEERGVSASAFWSYVAGGDRTPVPREDFDRLVSESTAGQE